MVPTKFLEPEQTVSNADQSVLVLRGTQPMDIDVLNVEQINLLIQMILKNVDQPIAVPVTTLELEQTVTDVLESDQHAHADSSIHKMAILASTAHHS